MILLLKNSFCHILNTKHYNVKTKEALVDMAARYYEFSKQNKNHWLMLFQTSLPDGQEYPDWYSASIAKIFEPLESIIAPLYKDKRAQKMAALGLWASMHGIIFLEATGKIPSLDPAKGAQSPNASDLVNFMITVFLK